MITLSSNLGLQVVTKAGHAVPKNAAVRVKAEEPKYVCRAGFKLEKALDHFGIDVTGLTALDSGLSTGGFTDCLLQRGARHVSRHIAATAFSRSYVAIAQVVSITRAASCCCTDFSTVAHAALFDASSS